MAGRRGSTAQGVGRIKAPPFLRRSCASRYGQPVHVLSRRLCDARIYERTRRGDRLFGKHRMAARRRSGALLLDRRNERRDEGGRSPAIRAFVVTARGRWAGRNLTMIDNAGDNGDLTWQNNKNRSR